MSLSIAINKCGQPLTAADWESYKPAIELLRMKLNRKRYTMKHVKEDLARDYNIHVTLSQLEHRVRKWGITKSKISVKLAKQIQECVENRRRQGKESQVVLNGEITPQEELDRRVPRTSDLHSTNNLHVQKRYQNTAYALVRDSSLFIWPGYVGSPELPVSVLVRTPVSSPIVSSEVVAFGRPGSSDMSPCYHPLILSENQHHQAGHSHVGSDMFHPSADINLPQERDRKGRESPRTADSEVTLVVIDDSDSGDHSPPFHNATEISSNLSNSRLHMILGDGSQSDKTAMNNERRSYTDSEIEADREHVCLVNWSLFPIDKGKHFCCPEDEKVANGKNFIKAIEAFDVRLVQKMLSSKSFKLTICTPRPQQQKDEGMSERIHCYKFQCTALHVATKMGNMGLLKAVLESGSYVAIDDLDCKGHSALHIAVLRRYINLINMLLNAGASIDEPCDQDQNEQCDQESKEQLLDPCLGISLLPLGSLYVTIHSGEFYQRTFGFTALHLAALHGDFDAVKVLLNAGANVHLTCPRGKTALHVTLEGLISSVIPERTVQSIIQQLLDAGAEPNAVDVYGNTPLHFAVAFGDCTLGARTPVEYAFAIGHCFLRSNADCNIANVAGCTPLHLATKRGWYHAIRALVNANAMLDVIDQEGETPLHKAIKASRKPGDPNQLQRYENVCALAKAGANCAIVDARGYTPLLSAICEQEPDHKMVKCLFGAFGKENVTKILRRECIETSIPVTWNKSALKLRRTLKKLGILLDVFGDAERLPSFENHNTLWCWITDHDSWMTKIIIYHCTDKGECKCNTTRFARLWESLLQNSTQQHIEPNFIEKDGWLTRKLLDGSVLSSE